MTASISTNVNDWISGTAISGTWTELHKLLSEPEGFYKTFAYTFASVVDKKFLDRRKKLELWPTEPINRIGVGINSGLWIRRSLPDKIREAVGDDDADFIYVQNYGFDERLVLTYGRSMAKGVWDKQINWSLEMPLDARFFTDWFLNEHLQEDIGDGEIKWVAQTESFMITGINNSSYVLNWPLLHDQMNILLEGDSPEYQAESFNTMNGYDIMMAHNYTTLPKRGLCPICNGAIPTNENPGAYPGATSRFDNDTEVCSACGSAEALTPMFSEEGKDLMIVAMQDDDWDLWKAGVLLGREPVDEMLDMSKRATEIMKEKLALGK